MPKYSDIIKFQDEAPNNVIRLVKSGEFYRAYDHSAWLFQCCIAEHKVIRKYVKSISREIYYIGFPEKSLFGNIGEHNNWLHGRKVNAKKKRGGRTCLQRYR